MGYVEVGRISSAMLFIPAQVVPKPSVEYTDLGLQLLWLFSPSKKSPLKDKRGEKRMRFVFARIFVVSKL